MPIPSLSHQTASLLRLNKAWAEAKGTPLSLRMLAGRPRSLKSLSNRGCVSRVGGLRVSGIEPVDELMDGRGHIGSRGRQPGYGKKGE